MESLSFIQEEVLREKVSNSITYSYLLFHEVNTSNSSNDIFKEETYRVIILYIISSIEAILLYLYKKRPERMTCVEYKHVNHLTSGFTHREKEGEVIVAVKTSRDKKDHEIHLTDLIEHLKGLHLIQKGTAEKILKLNDLRNTLHLLKARDKKCEITDMEEAFKILLHTIETAPKALDIKK